MKTSVWQVTFLQLKLTFGAKITVLKKQQMKFCHNSTSNYWRKKKNCQRNPIDLQYIEAVTQAISLTLPRKP